MYLSEAVDAFLASKSVSLSPQTVKSYGKDLNHLLSALDPDKPLEHITPSELEGVLKTLRLRRQRYRGHPRRPEEAGGLSRQTLRRIHKTWRTFFNWCLSRGLLQQSPAATVTPPRPAHHDGLSKAASADDLEAMLAYARQKLRNRARDYALLLFLIDTGCRIGGLCSLHLDRLWLSEGRALLEEKGEKNHLVFFGEATRTALLRWLSERPACPHRFVFTSQQGRPLTQNGASPIVRRIALAATGKSIGPHAIRHRVGQAWAEAGINPELIRLKLGHSSVTTTLTYYFNQEWQHGARASQQFSLLALGMPAADPPKILELFPSRRIG